MSKRDALNHMFGDVAGDEVDPATLGMELHRGHFRQMEELDVPKKFTTSTMPLTRKHVQRVLGGDIADWGDSPEELDTGL
jgi:hypothetical protein